jgi:hypothetical protein
MVTPVRTLLVMNCSRIRCRPGQAPRVFPELPIRKPFDPPGKPLRGRACLAAPVPARSRFGARRRIGCLLLALAVGIVLGLLAYLVRSFRALNHLDRSVAARGIRPSRAVDAQPGGGHAARQHHHRHRARGRCSGGHCRARSGTSRAHAATTLRFGQGLGGRAAGPARDSVAAAVQKMASGFSGDPVPPTIRSGSPTNRNSQRPSRSHTPASSSSCR